MISFTDDKDDCLDSIVVPTPRQLAPHHTPAGTGQQKALRPDMAMPALLKGSLDRSEPDRHCLGESRARGMPDPD